MEIAKVDIIFNDNAVVKNKLRFDKVVVVFSNALIRNRLKFDEVAVTAEAVAAADRAEQAADRAESFSSSVSFRDEDLYIDVGEAING